MGRKRSGRAPAGLGELLVSGSRSTRREASATSTTDEKRARRRPQGQHLTEIGLERAQRKFLQTLAQTANVSGAARAAGVDRATVYRWREASLEFAVAWDDALNEALDGLEQDVLQRAKGGSDLLAMFFLKAHRPDRYRETVTHQAAGEITLRVVYTDDWRGASGAAAMVESDGDATR